jgi:C1A family cysteine protease
MSQESNEKTLHKNTGGIKRKYLLKKDKIDPNNPMYQLHVFDLSKAILPPIVDLRLKCPAVYDQGDLGSCTANAIGGAYQYNEIKQNSKNIFVPSRLFIYYNERKMEGSINDDAGACIADGVASVHNVGVCDEKEWPYVPSKFAVAPSQTLYKKALNHKSGQYKRIQQNLSQIKTALAASSPVIFGMNVYESFESDSVAKTGVVPMPSSTDECLGGHAVLIVGYRDTDRKFIVRNSWGPTWGDKGYFYLPYQYVTDPNICSDFWTILNVVDK